MRFAIGLTIVGAALLITGLSMVFVGEALRLKSGQGGAGIVRPGELAAFCGLGIGVTLLVALTVGRADRSAAGRARGDRARGDRARGDRARRRWAIGPGARSAPRRNSAEEWLSPLRTAGAGLVPRRIPPSWPESAESRPGAGDYADDGWHPDMNGEWSPGPAYVWNPGEENGWDSGEDGDWDPAGDEDWDFAEPTGIMAWPPVCVADPEPGKVSGPAPVYRSTRDGEYVGSTRDGEYVGSPRDGEYVGGPEAGYLSPGLVAERATAPRHAADPETAYSEAAASDVSDADGTRVDEDTSPIPVIRGPGQPGSQPRSSEPLPAPKSFSVWEPAPKPGQQQGRDGRSNDVYQPAHAEPPSANTQEKIEQIKDLYLTAEAIGEDALGTHFDQLRQRQRSLISEFFEKAGLGSNDTPTLVGDDPAQDGASLPG